MRAGALKYVAFNTEMGWVGIMGSAKGLVGVTLPQCSAQEVCLLLGDGVQHAVHSAEPFEDLIQRFCTYFSGGGVAFPDTLDFSCATPFQRDVWLATRSIIYGETRSYAWVARQIGKPVAVRAVGQALSRNPWPIIIPCHRVLTSDGKLGGFAGGLDMKRRLLDLESASTR
ncbi:methylated-DNA--[protein]-cysteine S-methyltransferase [Chloroflexota bacterium]